MSDQHNPKIQIAQLYDQVVSTGNGHFTGQIPDERLVKAQITAEKMGSNRDLDGQLEELIKNSQHLVL